MPFIPFIVINSRPLSILCLMYRQLWERETYTLLIEYRVDGLVHIEINSPIVLTLHPGTDNHIHATGIQCMKGYKKEPDH